MCPHWPNSFDAITQPPSEWPWAFFARTTILWMRFSRPISPLISTSPPFVRMRASRRGSAGSSSISASATFDSRRAAFVGSGWTMSNPATLPSFCLDTCLALRTRHQLAKSPQRSPKPSKNYPSPCGRWSSCARLVVSRQPQPPMHSAYPYPPPKPDSSVLAPKCKRTSNDSAGRNSRGLIPPLLTHVCEVLMLCKSIEHLATLTPIRLRRRKSASRTQASLSRILGTTADRC